MITDGGLMHLVSLHQLKLLNLSNCPLITDAGFVLCFNAAATDVSGAAQLH